MLIRYAMTYQGVGTPSIALVNQHHSEWKHC